MGARIYGTNGVLREEWNDATRTYTAWDDQGVQTSSRPYTAIENSLANAEAAQAVLDSNKQTIESALADALAEVQTIIDATNATINAGPAPYIKILARAVRRIIRLVIRRFEGTG